MRHETTKVDVLQGTLLGVLIFPPCRIVLLIYVNFCIVVHWK